jgi:hypothetical protein
MALVARANRSIPPPAQVPTPAGLRMAMPATADPASPIRDLPSSRVPPSGRLDTRESGARDSMSHLT